MGIEPTFSAWEADVLPLNDTRECLVPISVPASAERKKRLAREYFAGFRRWQRLRSYEDRQLVERAAVW